MIEMTILALVVGGFTWKMIGPDSPRALRLAELEREIEGLKDLRAWVIIAQDHIENGDW